MLCQHAEELAGSFRVEQTPLHNVPVPKLEYRSAVAMRQTPPAWLQLKMPLQEVESMEVDLKSSIVLGTAILRKIRVRAATKYTTARRRQTIFSCC
ncbi:hypothetical protein X801_00177 [Opisthorchis viverrini]|uniref:Uncharacterized protein n=1 Tax=Opisthorchis viverrini TaxID=6198 RepID=A0A1S8XB14_OPIVI|nr:hypothetical protein X801_00177 [Opisthorchis viverrini]